jgi:hypothetical protein
MLAHVLAPCEDQEGFHVAVGVPGPVSRQTGPGPRTHRGVVAVAVKGNVARGRSPVRGQ